MPRSYESKSDTARRRNPITTSLQDCFIKDILEIKSRLNLLIAVVIPLLVIIIVRLFGVA